MNKIMDLRVCIEQNAAEKDLYNMADLVAMERGSNYVGLRSEKDCYIGELADDFVLSDIYFYYFHINDKIYRNPYQDTLFGQHAIYIDESRILYILCRNYIFDIRDTTLEIVEAFSERKLSEEEKAEYEEIMSALEGRPGRPYFLHFPNRNICIFHGEIIHITHLADLSSIEGSDYGYFFAEPDNGDAYVENIKENKVYRLVAETNSAWTGIVDSLGNVNARKKVKVEKINDTLRLINDAIIYDVEKKKIIYGGSYFNSYINKEKQKVLFTRDYYIGVMVEDDVATYDIKADTLHVMDTYFKFVNMEVKLEEVNETMEEVLVRCFVIHEK